MQHDCSMYMYIWFFSCFIRAYSQFHTFQPTPIKVVNLTTTNTIDNYANITVLNTGDVSIDTINNEWDIFVASQSEYHLGINLDDTWGFHPTKVSAIKLTIYSSTQLSATDRDLIVTFSVNSNQFISTMLLLDTGHTSGNAIGPPAFCDATPTPTVTMTTGDVKSCVDQDTCTMNGCVWNCDLRVNKAFVSNTGWSNSRSRFDPIYPGSMQQLPITLMVINDPINDYSFVSQTNPGYDGNIQHCGYNAFPSNSGLQIYIALDDDEETMSFNKFEIKYFYNVTTAPTFQPTSQPTSTPTTSIPTTSVPTNTPTNDPATATPTTDNPTINPTTGNPTDNPTTNTPVTSQPNTDTPVTAMPITSAPITNVPITATPITSLPTANVPTDLPTSISVTESITNNGDSNNVESNSKALDGTMIGIIVGGSVCGILICIVLFILYKKRKNKKNTNHMYIKDTFHDPQTNALHPPKRRSDGDYTQQIPPTSPKDTNDNINTPQLMTVGDVVTPAGPVDVMDDNGTELLMNMMLEKHLMNNPQNGNNIEMIKNINPPNNIDDNEPDLPDDDGFELPPVPVIDDDIKESKQTKGYIEHDYSSSDDDGDDGEQQIIISVNNKITGFEWIESTLKQIDNKEWQKYLDNFKKQKMTESRLKHVTFDKEYVWDKLLPEMGVKLEFKELWKKRQNNYIG